MALLLGWNALASNTNHGDLTAMNSATALTVMYWTVRTVAGQSTCGIEKLPMSFFEMTSDLLVTTQVGLWTLTTTTYTVLTDTWLHHAFVFDGSLGDADRVKLYSNAVRLTVSGGPPAATLPDMSGNSLEVGRNNVAGVGGFVRVWTAALTQAEIAHEMLRYWAFRRADLVLDAPYDDQTAARDYSGNGFHGTWNPINGVPIPTGAPIAYGGKVLVTG